MTTKEDDPRICFVIAPIDSEGSVVRQRSDQVLKHIIAPAVVACGYEAIRADHIPKPGLITSQVIQHVIEDPLVIADLTGWNPNVFYELALRHALRKPVIQIIHDEDSLPFDVAMARTVPYDHHDLDSVEKAKEDIMKQIRSFETDPTDVETPISAAFEVLLFRQSEKPLDRIYAEILTVLQELGAAVAELREKPRYPRIAPHILDRLRISLGRNEDALNLEEGMVLTSEQLQEIRRYREQTERLVDVLSMEVGVPPHLFRRGPRIRGGPATEKAE
ncbi:MAG: hypothetical protein ACYC35_16110 [Pirellulales bacterium]